MGGMQEPNQGNAPSTNGATPAISLGVREGMYVQRGQTLLNIADPSHVSALIQVQADDMGKIQKGNKVKLIITGTADSLVTGKVDLIEPIFRNGKKSVTIRVFITNKGHKCRIGSPLKAFIAGNSMESIWVPSTTVVDLGRYQMVWLMHNKVLEAHRVQIGIKNGAWIEILNGLTTKDEIATEAHYLSDSESWVKTANSEQ
jgi:Cu(I)/Ag(I) efflux system membrane fusion protein